MSLFNVLMGRQQQLNSANNSLADVALSRAEELNTYKAKAVADLEANKQSLVGEFSQGGLLDTVVATAAAPVTQLGNGLASALEMHNAANETDPIKAAQTRLAAKKIRDAMNMDSLVGINSDTGERTSSLWQRGLVDPAIAVAQGSASALQGAVGIASLASGGRAGKAAEEMGFRPKDGIAALEAMASPEMQKMHRDIASADGFSNTAGEILANPSSIPLNIIKSVPSMLFGGAVGKALGAAGVGTGLAGAVGEGVMMAGSQAENIREETKDNLLDFKQSLYAAGTGVMGAGVGLLGNRLAGKMRVGDIDEALVSGTLAKSPRGAVSSGLISGGIEGGEEVLQSTGETIAKNLALDKPFDQGVGNAAAMGLFTGAPMGAVTGMAAGSENSKQAKAVERAVHEVATANNDTSIYLNKDSAQFNPVKAMEVLLGHAELPTTAAEVKSDNFNKAKEVTKSAEDALDRANAIYDVITATPEQREQYKAYAEKLRAEIDTIDPADTTALEKKTAILSAFEEGLAAPAGKSDRVRQAAEVTRRTEELKGVRNVQEQFSDVVRGKVDAEVVATDLVVAKSSVDANDSSAVTASKASAERLINLSMASKDVLDETTALEIADNQTNGISDAQRTYLREFSKARIEQNRLETQDSVASTILVGDKYGNLGLKQYTGYIGDALASDDKGRALRYMEMLSNFAQSHVEKAKVGEVTLNKAKELGRTVQLLKEGGTSGKWFVHLGKRKDPSERERIGGLDVHPNSEKSTNLLKAIPKEAVAITQTLAAQVAAYQLKFGEAPMGIVVPSLPKAATSTPQAVSVVPTAAVTPVNTSTGSVQIPAALVGKSIESLFPGTEEKYRIMEGNQNAALTNSQSNAKSDKENQATRNEYETLRAKKNRSEVEELHLASLGDSMSLVELKNNPRGELKSFQEDLTEQLNQLDSLGQEDASYVAQRKPVVVALLGQLNEFELRAKAAKESSATAKSPAVSLASSNPAEGSARPKSETSTEKKTNAQTTESQQEAQDTAERDVEAAIEVAFEDATLEDQQAYLEAFEEELNNESAQTSQTEVAQESSTEQSAESTGSVQGASTGKQDENSGKDEGQDSQTESTGKLGVFTDYKDRITGSISDVFKNANLIAHYFKQSGVVEGAKAQRPLVAVKDFLSQWKEGKVSAKDFLPADFESNEFKEAALRHLRSTLAGTKTRQGWADLVSQSFLKLRWIEGKTSIKEATGHIDFKSSDMMQYLYLDGVATADTEENIKTALAAAAYSWAVDAANSPMRMKEELINGMHGKQNEQRISSEGKAVLQDMHSFEHTLISSLGKAVVQSLGLKVRDEDTPVNLMPRLENALGTHAMMLLINRGFIVPVSLPYSQVESYFGNDTSKDGTPVTSKEMLKYIKVVYPKGALSAEMEAIKEANRGSQDVVNTLFAFEKEQRMASTKPAAFNQNKGKDTNQDVSKMQKASIDQTQHEKHSLIPEMWGVYLGMGKQALLQIAGSKVINEEDPQYHVVNIPSIQAQNDNLENQLDQTIELLDSNKNADNPDGLDGVFYVLQEAWRNFRAGFTTRSLNQQTSKIHRSLFSKPSWTVKLKFDDTNMVNEFLISIAMGLGAKTDQQRNVKTLAKEFDMIAGIAIFKNDDIMEAAEVIRQGLLQGDSSEVWNTQNIDKVVKVASKEGMMSLQSLVAYAKYLNAFEAQQKDFEFTLLVGADGKTNGPMLTLLALGAADYSVLNMGGMYSISEDQAKHFSEYYEDPAAMDLYQKLGRNVFTGMQERRVNSEEEVAHFKAVFATLSKKEQNQMRGREPFSNATFDAFQVLSGQLDAGTKVTSAMRNLVKTPLTAFFFGSSLKRAVASMEDAFIDGFYLSLEELKQGTRKDGKTLQDFLQATQSLIKQGSDGLMVQPLNTNMDIDAALKYVLNPNQEIALRKSFQVVMGNSVKETMGTQFAEFVVRRDVVNKTVQGAYAVYAAAYADARNAMVKELMASGKIHTREAIVNKEKIPLPVHDLTEAQEKVLRLKVRHLLPEVHSNYSRNENNIRAGLFMAKSKVDKSGSPLYGNDVAIAADRNGYRTRYGSQSLTYVDIDPGVSGLSYMMHSSDSFIMHSALLDVPETLNVHDEGSNSVPKVRDTALALNKATVETFLNYSPARESAKTLERLINGMALHVAGGFADKETVKGLFVRWEKVMNPYGKTQGNLKAAAQNLLNAAFDNAYRADFTRLTNISKMAVMDQYTWEGGQFQVTQEMRDQAKSMLDALIKKGYTPAAKVQESLTYLTEVMEAAVNDPVAVPDWINMEQDADPDAETESAPVTTESLGVPGVIANEVLDLIAEANAELAEAAKSSSVEAALNSLPPAQKAQAIQAIVTARANMPEGSVTPWGITGTPAIDSDRGLVEAFESKPVMTAKEALVMLRDKLKAEGKDTGYNKFMFALIQKLYKVMPADTKIKYITSANTLEDVIQGPNSPSRGWYISRGLDNEIYVLSPEFLNSGLTAETLLHEMLHAALLYVTESPHGEAQALVTDLEGLRKKAIEFAKKTKFKDHPGLGDLHEFIAWGMTNRKFQAEVLNKVTFESKVKGNPLITGMQKFITTVSNFLFKNAAAREQELMTNGLSVLIANVSGLFEQAANNQNTTLQKPKNLSMAAQINSFSTLDIHDALDTGQVSPEFSEHLRTVLSTIVEKLHGSAGSFKAKIMEGVPMDALGVLNEALATGVAPFTSELQASGFKFNNQTFFAAEQVEASVKAILDTKDGKLSAVHEELRKLEAEVRKQMTPQSFFKGDWFQATKEERDEATKLYEYLFKNVDGDYLARFAALGLAHEGFNALLKMPTSQAPAVLKDRSVGNTLTRLFGKILETANGKLTHTKAGQPADQKLAALVRQLVEIENRRKSMLLNPATGIAHFADQKVRAARRGTKDTFSTLLNSAMFKKNKNNTVAALSHLGDAVMQNNVKYLFKNMNVMRNSASPGIQGPIAGSLMDMHGAKTALQTLFREGKAHLEGARKKIIEGTSKNVLESFAEAGAYLSTEAKGAITAVLLRTGAHVLLDHFDLVQMEKLVSDSSALTKEIANFEAKLSGLSGVHKSFVIKHSKALGYHLITNTTRIENMMRNAGNIAHLRMSVYEGQLTAATIADITPTIDALVSLYALSYSKSLDRAEVSKVLAKENGRTDTLKGENGIKMTLLMAKESEAESKERLFKDSEVLMTKGYMPEIYNPHTDLKAATLEEGALLENLGYKKVSMLSLDKNDPFREPRALYVLHGGGLRPWLSGMFSFTSMKAKGTKHHGDTAKGTQAVLARLAGAGRVVAGEGEAFDPRKVSDQFMVPLMNPLGKAVNYHYLMQAQTKDVLLERNNNFDEVLGVLNGNIFDKEKSPVHNRKVVELLYEDFKEGFTKESTAYLKVGPDSPVKELRDIYAMLPQSTKDAIREVWGKDEMLVRAENLDIAFGYRKNGLASIFEKDVVDRNAVEQMVVWFVQRVMKQAAKQFMKIDGKPMTDAQAEKYSMSAAVVVSRGERAWQEIVHEVKDIYVVKNLLTSINNFKSNLITLLLYGVNPVSGIRDMRIAWVGAEEHHRDSQALYKLEQQLATGYILGDTTETKLEVARLKLALENNPVNEMIQAGLMPTIVEDVGADEDPYAYKSALAKKVSKYTDKLNPNVKSAAKMAYMAHDTKLYQGLSRVVQLSDFVARYAVYQHLINRKENPISKELAIQEASDAFINYDIPMHRDLQYMDDMGLFMFTKYFLRVQRVIRGRFVHAPGKTMALLGLEAYLGDLPTIVDSSILTASWGVPLQGGALQFPSALGEIAPIKVATGLFR